MKSNLIRDFNPIIDNSIYELPDRNNLIIGKEVNELPEMILGTDRFPGITKMVLQVISLIP